MLLIRKIMSVFHRDQKIKLFLLFIMITIGSLFEMLGVTIISPIISIALDPSIINDEGSWYYKINSFMGFKEENQFVLFLLLSMVILYIVKNIYLGFMYSKQYRFINNCQKRLSTQLFSAYLDKPYLFFTTKNSSQLLRSVNNDSFQFFFVVQNILLFLTDAMIAVVLALALFFQDPYIMLIVVALLLTCSAIFLVYFKKVSFRLGQNKQYQQGKMNQWLNQAFGGIKEIKILNRERFFVKSYEQHFSTYVDCESKSQLIGQMPKFIIETICVAGILLTLSIKLINGGSLSDFVPQLSVFAMAAFRLLPAANRITSYFNNIMFYKPSIDLVYDDLTEVESRELPSSDIEISGNELKFEKSILVDDVSFRYPGSEEYVLEHVTFEISKGKSIAFIGPSGAGKTTVVDIVLGLLKPENGIILVDGVDICLRKKEWNKKIGYIPQFIYLTDDTIRNNIAFGISDNDIQDDKIWKALEEAQLKEFVNHLPEGLDTPVGEVGARLSGGQRQRIGIARALYNSPEILVLDEATSALDSDTESAVMDAIYSLKGIKTLIIIAHRLSTIQKCDIVYEIRNKDLFKK